MSNYKPRLDPLRESCVYAPQGVQCLLPGCYGRIPPECKTCGWYPDEAEQRKLQLHENGKIIVKKGGKNT